MTYVPETEQLRQVDDTIPLAGSARTQFSFDDTFDHAKVPFEKDEVPVLIIGSSMVGMFLGLLLGFHGNAYCGKLYKGRTIAAHQESDPAVVAQVTPCKRLWLTQNMFEPLLRGRAGSFGSQPVFGAAVVHYEEDKDGVIVVLQDSKTGENKKNRTKYLVASDGNRSATRHKESIEWHGPGAISNNISVNFTANLKPYLGKRSVHGVTYITNPRISAGFRLEKQGPAGFMLVSRTSERENGFEVDSVSEKEAGQMFIDASGIEDDVGLKVSSISYWTVARFCADRFASKGGRVFIMGDAAHVMPPTGGMGGNTGVADAYNLAWKLAFVLKGWSPPSLLQSYDRERPPAAKFMMDQAFTRLVNRVFHGKGFDHYKHSPELPDLVCELGGRYHQGAFVLSTEEMNGPLMESEDPHKALAMAGCRLPHVWLRSAEGQAEVLSLDLIKQRLVLLTTDTELPWLTASKEQGFPIDACAITPDSSPYCDEHGKAGERLKLGNGEAMLVRPDGYIAWKGEKKGAGDYKEELKTILEQLFCA